MIKADVVIRLVTALLWLLVGVYCLYRPKRMRSYVKGLPDSPGNLQIKARARYLSVLGVVTIAIGMYHLLRLSLPER